MVGSGGGGGRRACHNCGNEGHIARKCTEPKDWSRVKCNNCHQFGHTVKRCNQPITESTEGDWGAVNDSVAATTDGWGDALQEATGNWADDTTAAAGDDNSWGESGAANASDW